MNAKLGTIAAVLATVWLIGAATEVAAQGKGPGRGGFGGGRHAGWCERMAEPLDLTEEQREKFARIHEEGRKESVALRKEMLRLRHELRGVMLEDEPDLERAVKLTEKIGGIETKMQVRRLRQRFEVRKVLTPEQRDRAMLHGHRPGGCGPAFGPRGDRCRGGHRFPRGGRPGGPGRFGGPGPWGPGAEEDPDSP